MRNIDILTAEDKKVRHSIYCMMEMITFHRANQLDKNVHVLETLIKRTARINVGLMKPDFLH